MTNIFLSRTNAAKFAGVSPHQFDRVVELLDLEPVEFSSSAGFSKYIWIKQKLEEKLDAIHGLTIKKGKRVEKKRPRMSLGLGKLATNPRLRRGG